MWGMGLGVTSPRHRYLTAMDDPLKQPGEAREPEQMPDLDGTPVEQRPKPLYPGLPTGTGLGKYRILERLWTAHNAIVYKARDATLDRLVTIKQMSPSLIDNPVACGHFKREAQFMARVPMDARHVVGIHELIEDDLGLFIVEEYIVGQWLESMIAKRKMDPLAAVRILRSAAQGLRTLHALNLVHRGVHPGNIIVGRAHGAKIANLTTAAHEGDTTPPPTIVPKYAAPELLAGGHYDDRVDIYSLGMSIYEFCVGRNELHQHFGLPLDHSAASVDRWASWHTNPRASLPDAGQLNPLVPAALASILRKMTAKPLSERYASMQEVLDALARHFGSSREQLDLRPLVPFGHGSPAPAGQYAPVQGYVFETRTTGAFLPLYSNPALPPMQAPPTSRHTVRQSIPMAAFTRPADPQPVLGISAGDEMQIRTINRQTGRRPRLIRRAPTRPVQPETIPAPAQASEVHRPQSRFGLWLVAAAVVLGAVGVCTATLWYYHARSSEKQIAEQVLNNAIAAYQRGEYDAAKQKLLEAAQTPGQSEAAANVRARAECWLPMIEARRALARNEFDEALHYARQAEKRGMNPSEVTELQMLCWAKKDAYRLEAESSKALEQGRLKEAELAVDEYKQKAQAGGLDPSKLESRLEQSRADLRFDEALKRARQAMDQDDFDQAALAVGDAERIRSTSETKKLRQRITNGKERADWIQRGDSAMLDKDYAEAASAYEKANQVWATTEIEKKARTAAALLLVEKAQEALDKGDLLTAERHLQSSMWKTPTQQVATRLEKLAPAFEAAKLAHKADEQVREGDYAEAQRLYLEAIPQLPPPADAAAKNKLAEVRQILAIQRGDEAFQQGDWQAALEAYQEAKSLGHNGDVNKKIDAAKTKLHQQ